VQKEKSAIKSNKLNLFPQRIFNGSEISKYIFSDLKEMLQ